MEAVHRLHELMYLSPSCDPLVNDGLEWVRDEDDVKVGEFFLLGDDFENLTEI